MRKDIEQLAGVFGALGQVTRLEIVRLLAPLSKGKAPIGLAAGQIAAALGVAPPTLSFHLKDMALRNIVRHKRKGRELIYVANLPLIAAALGELVSELEV